MSSQLEKELAAAKDRYRQAVAAVSTALSNHKSLEEHHRKGLSWQTHSDEQLKQDFADRWKLYTDALTERTLAESAVRASERRIEEKLRSDRHLAAKGAKELAIQNEKKKAEQLKREPSRKEELELKQEGPQLTRG